jgi:hypothetical protein
MNAAIVDSDVVSMLFKIMTLAELECWSLERGRAPREPVSSFISSAHCHPASGPQMIHFFFTFNSQTFYT